MKELEQQGQKLERAGGYTDEGVKMLSFSSLCSPTPRQREFIEAVMTPGNVFTLYGGARGGGKSYILRWTAVYFLMVAHAMGFKGVRVAIFCETFPTLKDRQLSRARMGRDQERYPDWLGTWNLADKEFRLHPQFGGGVVCFRNLDDPGKYLSAEFAMVLVDELTRNPVEVFNAIRGSRRWPGMEHTPFAAATNPGSIGHAWVKDVWVDGTFSLDETKALLEVYGRGAFKYVKALAYDNPHNAATYLKELQSLPERLRKAFLDGNWDSFEGQAFTEWDREVHVVPNGVRHLKGWRWVAGLDWGYRKGWFGLMAVGPEGRVEIVWEAYFGGVHARKAARMICKAIREFPPCEVIYYDGQMDQDTGVKGGLTLKTQWLRGMLDVYGSLERSPAMIPGAKGKGSRQQKYETMHRFLAWDDVRDAAGEVQPWARPRLTAQERCRHFIRTLPALPVDPDRPEEDVDTSAEDHPYDGACFVLLSLDDSSHPEDQRPRDLSPKHPGFDRKQKRRRRRYALDEDDRRALSGVGARDEGYALPTEDDYTRTEDFR